MFACDKMAAVTADSTEACCFFQCVLCQLVCSLEVLSSGPCQGNELVFMCLCNVRASLQHSEGALTLPVVPRDRWFICWVIGPIMLAGCMDIVWSMAGVITAPWWNERKDKEMVR